MYAQRVRGNLWIETGRFTSSYRTDKSYVSELHKSKVSSLFPFQQHGVKFLTDHKRVLLADEVGLGKSVQSLMAVEELDAFPLLIVCPAGLRLNWKHQVETWLPHRRARILSTKPAPENSPADIYIVNYEIAHRFIDAARASMKSLIVDESQNLGNPKSRRTRAVTRIAEALEVKFLLSGTPVMNRPAELIPQLQILEVLKYFGGSYKFAERYCNLHFNGYGMVADGATHLDELNERLLIFNCFLRRTKREVLDEFPATRTMRVDVEIDDAEIENAEQKLVRDYGCLSHAEKFGHVMKLYQTLGVAKLKPAEQWVRDFIDNTGKKLVVFAAHQIVQNELVSAFGGEALQILSETSFEDRHANIKQFTDDESKKVMVCSLRAAGAGIDGLQHATDTVLFVEMGWNPPTHDQAVGRLHRMGQKNCVDAYFLVAPDTFDADIWDLVQVKKRTIDKVNGEVVRGMQLRRQK